MFSLQQLLRKLNTQDTWSLWNNIAGQFFCDVTPIKFFTPNLKHHNHNAPMQETVTSCSRLRRIPVFPSSLEMRPTLKATVAFCRQVAGPRSLTCVFACLSLTHTVLHPGCNISAHTRWPTVWQLHAGQPVVQRSQHSSFQTWIWLTHFSALHVRFKVACTQSATPPFLRMKAEHTKGQKEPNLNKRSG